MAHKWWEYFCLLVICLLCKLSKPPCAWQSCGNIHLCLSIFVGPDKILWKATDFPNFCLLRWGLLTRLDYHDHIKPSQPDFDNILIDSCSSCRKDGLSFAALLCENNELTITCNASTFAVTANKYYIINHLYRAICCR